MKFSLDVSRLARFTSSIWKVHSFYKANTKNVAVFIIKYLRSLGYNVNLFIKIMNRKSRNFEVNIEKAEIYRRDKERKL